MYPHGRNSINLLSKFRGVIMLPLNDQQLNKLKENIKYMQEKFSDYKKYGWAIEESERMEEICINN